MAMLRVAWTYTRQAPVGTATRQLVDQGYDSRAIRAEEFGSAAENSTQGGAG